MSMLFLILVVVLIVWGIALFAGYRATPAPAGPWASAVSILAWVSVVILTLLWHGARF